MFLKTVFHSLNKDSFPTSKNMFDEFWFENSFLGIYYENKMIFEIILELYISAQCL